jgi:hypothetical protein
MTYASYVHKQTTHSHLHLYTLIVNVPFCSQCVGRNLFIFSWLRDAGHVSFSDCEFLKYKIVFVSHVRKMKQVNNLW